MVALGNFSEAYPRPDAYAEGIAYAIWLGPLLVMTLTSTFIALWFKKTRVVFKSTGYQLSIVALMTSGGMLHVLWMLGLFSGNLAGSVSILVIQSILVGISTSLFRIEIDRVFGFVGANQTLFITFAGLLVATVVVVALMTLPRAVWFLAPVVFPPLFFVCFRKSLRGISSPKYYAHGLENKLFIPVKFLSTSFFQGVAFGVMSGSMLLLSLSGSDWSAGRGSRILALLLIGVIVLMFKLDYNQLLYKIGFPFMAFGFVCLIVFPATPQIGGALAWAGYLFLDVILWSLGAHLIKNAGLPATWIASFPGAALSAGTLIGAGIGIYATQQGDEIIVPFGGLMAAFLLAVALVMTSGRNIRYGWGTSRPYHNDDQKDWVERVCRLLSIEHGLTRRESDVLVFLIQNKRKKEIGHILCVSLDTVKTHTRNIYRKFMIHSQDELAEIVEAAGTQLGMSEEVGDPSKSRLA
jgi:DNA-binding CsgD family transcriptional regulator